MKYFSKKVKIDGLAFDSKAEYLRYLELKELEKKGDITNLELQPQFILQPSFNHKSLKIKQRQMVYTADFSYHKNGELFVEEFKSKYTAKLTDYRIRIKLFLYKYPDINFIETIK